MVRHIKHFLYPESNPWSSLAPPTQVQVYQTLVDTEHTSELSSEIRHNQFLGDAQLINLGIHIEDEQWVTLCILLNLFPQIYLDTEYNI